ncbi:alginate lyase [Pseudoxanthomonas suwonensis]|uniref:Alginate lyase n=2 Tax=Pseudoxanthomonas suwonensis TaxID=314722 RepID=A0A0E3UPW0_9GAMM|nr:alginate lyase [Pseudoxanthomonas suwonensis]
MPAAAVGAAGAAAASRDADTGPVLVGTDEWKAMAEAGARYPLFARERARIEASVRAAMDAGVVVPRPKDPGGGYTHEQHKRNYLAIQNAGALYRLTGDRAYADFVRDTLLEYARLYPTLGPHPAGRGEIPGRLFWQTLNDSVWLVHAIQGYDAVRAGLDPEDRRTIEEQVFRRMARFLSDETPANFQRIHNHATWAVAAVGMTGYVLRDEAMVEKALLGLSRDGEAGFLRQIDRLFSPDGYYEEGPYYQRYALAPFVVFANVIERNEPQRRIFERRDGVLLKAVDTLAQSSYAGYFIPINDALLDKGLDTAEMVAGIAIAYARSGDARLLSIAERQGRVLLSPEGLEVARALAAGEAEPFVFRPLMLRDGPEGDRGGLALLRRGGADGQLLVMKNTAQGMGHGHFDKLNWLFYDNGRRVVTDYGAARFLNIEAKAGGIYLPENTSWAKQTVAHNTLVVDERSHFGGNWRRGEAHAPTLLLFEAGEGLQIASARMDGAYEGVAFTRTQALVEHAELGLPVVVDLLRVHGDRAARYDLPLHYAGQIMKVGFDARRELGQRPVLGEANGYQHLWVDAVGEPSAQTRSLTWLLDGRFYTHHFGASAPTRAILAESGANDPEFNLRREPVLIQRMDGQSQASFFAVLEPHGEYNGSAEYVTGADSRIREVRHFRGATADVVALTLVSGTELALGIAHYPSAGPRHRVAGDGHAYEWTGPYARFDRPATARRNGSNTQAKNAQGKKRP